MRILLQFETLLSCMTMHHIPPTASIQLDYNSEIYTYIENCNILIWMWGFTYKQKCNIYSSWNLPKKCKNRISRNFFRTSCYISIGSYMSLRIPLIGQGAYFSKFQKIVCVKTTFQYRFLVWLTVYWKMSKSL